MISIVFYLATVFMLPNRQLTPGAAATTDAAQVCTPRYAEKHRNVSAKTAAEVYAAYRMHSVKGVCCEVDHLIPLELGGSNAKANLWPQLWAEAREKDKVENFLHRQVCSGKMPLATAQRMIVRDWRKVRVR
jgi:hypothetical protein